MGDDKPEAAKAVTEKDGEQSILCELCGKDKDTRVKVKNWPDHMAKVHPAEWKAELERQAEETRPQFVKDLATKVAHFVLVAVSPSGKVEYFTSKGCPLPHLVLMGSGGGKWQSVTNINDIPALDSVLGSFRRSRIKPILDKALWQPMP